MKKKLSQTAQIQLLKRLRRIVRSLCSLALTDIHAVAWLGGRSSSEGMAARSKKLAIACSHAPTCASKHTPKATT